MRSLFCIAALEWDVLISAGAPKGRKGEESKKKKKRKEKVFEKRRKRKTRSLGSVTNAPRVVAWK